MGHGPRPSEGDGSLVEEQVVTWDQIKANWKNIKGKARVAWGGLSDDDLEQIRGSG